MEEVKNLKRILPESIETEVKLQLDSRWWLDKTFGRLNCSYLEGVFLVYGFIESFRLIFLPHVVIGHAAFVSGFLGDLFVPFSLLMVHILYKSLINLKRNVNIKLRKKEFIAPSILITEEELESSVRLAKLDEEYRNRYVKPVMIKTLQYGFDLSFNNKYQLGSGLIAAGLFLLVMFMTLVLKILPENLFMVVDITGPQVRNVFNAWVYAMWGFEWFIIGMATWTLFMIFLLNTKTSGNPIRVRPFESIKECFVSMTSLTLKTSFTLTFITAWISPAVLVWSVTPVVDPKIRAASVIFVSSVVAVMIPVIILSFVVPVLKVDEGMSKTRERLLLLKKHQLEKLKKEKIRKSDPNTYIRIEEHLIQDYKDVQNNPVGVLNVPQILELSVTILLPIITFFISTWV